jgi:glycolate oxidase subunit GlcD
MKATSLEQTLDSSLERELRLILGDEGLVTDPSALLVYESDGLMSYRMRPLAVVLPRGTEQVSQLLRALDAAEIAFVPRGAGTGLAGGATAVEGAIVLSLARMNRILGIDAENRRAIVEPGVVNARLTDATRPHGLYYAPDPSSQSVCTIGGNVAANAGGPHCLKHGVTLNHILAATVVLAGGDVVHLGGYGETELDLLGVFVGSEGTFGVATEITVQLSRRPERVETMLALFDTTRAATQAVSDIIASGLLPSALEMVDRLAIMAVEASVYAAGLPTDIEAALVIEFDGASEGPALDAERAIAICRSHDAREVRRAENEAERARLWNARKKAYGAMGRLAPDVLVQDAVVPRSRLPDILETVYAIAVRHDLRLCNTFHAGDGNLHPTILFDRRNAGDVARVEAASKEILQACLAVGGTITGEHGVGIDKRDSMPLVASESEMVTMCDVRRVFDPHVRANPAKVLPVRMCREWVGPATRRIDV